MEISKFIKSSGYFTLNKSLIHQVGLEAAVYLTNLVEKYEYLSKLNKLWWDNKNECWVVPASKPNIQKNTGIGRRAQDTARKKLEDLGLIHFRKMGTPATNCFYIDKNAVVSLVDSTSARIVPTSDTESYRQVSTKRTDKSARNVPTIRKTISNPISNPIRKPANFSDFNADLDAVISVLNSGEEVSISSISPQLKSYLLDEGIADYTFDGDGLYKREYLGF